MVLAHVWLSTRCGLCGCRSPNIGKATFLRKKLDDHLYVELLRHPSSLVDFHSALFYLATRTAGLVKSTVAVLGMAASMPEAATTYVDRVQHRGMVATLGKHFPATANVATR